MHCRRRCPSCSTPALLRRAPPSASSSSSRRVVLLHRRPKTPAVLLLLFRLGRASSPATAAPERQRSRLASSRPPQPRRYAVYGDVYTARYLNRTSTLRAKSPARVFPRESVPFVKLIEIWFSRVVVHGRSDVVRCSVIRYVSATGVVAPCDASGD